MHKEAGRPWPVICPEDDVVDYMVMEAVYIRYQQAEKKAAKEAKRKKWKEERDHLSKLG